MAGAAKKREVLDLPALPTGLATRLGQLMVGALAIATVVFAVNEGGGETIAALGGTVLTAVTVMAGRYAQSCALLKQVPSPVTATANGIVATSTVEGTPAAATGTPAATVVIQCCHCADHTHD